MTEPAAPKSYQIGILAQYVKDFSFESPNTPQIFAPTTEVPQVNIGVNVLANVLPDASNEVILKLKLTAELSGKTAFIVELAYAGVFALPDMAEDQKKIILFVEAPHILFPFARSVIANAVRDGGFPQFLLNPVDFAGLYQASQSKMSAPTEGNA